MCLPYCELGQVKLCITKTSCSKKELSKSRDFSTGFLKPAYMSLGVFMPFVFYQLLNGNTESKGGCVCCVLEEQRDKSGFLLSALLTEGVAVEKHLLAEDLTKSRPILDSLTKVGPNYADCAEFLVFRDDRKRALGT